MKISKKVILFMTLISILISSFLLSCNSGNNSNNNNGNVPDAQNNTQGSSDNTGTTENPAAKDDLAPQDFGGKDFTILVNPDPSFRHFYDVCVESMNGELVNDAAYNRNLAVEDRFNVQIKDNQVKDVAGTIKKSVSAGTVDFSAAWVIITDYGTLSKQNMFTDLYTIPNLNLQKIYWDQNVVRDFTLDNKLYGIMGDISTSVSVFTHLLGLNKVAAQDNGIDVASIYQSARDGTWTLDKFYSIIKGVYRDLDGDGTTNYADLYGFGVSPAICETTFTASGEKWVGKDANGNLVLNQPTARITDVYNKLMEILTDKYATYTTWESAGKVKGPMRTTDYEYVYYDKFMNNTVLFDDIDMGIVMDYRQLVNSDFGIVPEPKFEESQPNYSVYAYPFYPMLTVPSTYSGDSDSLNFIGTIMEGLGSSSYKILTPAFYDTAFQTKYTRDDDSIEMLDIILHSRIYDFMNVYNFGGFDTAIWNQVQKADLNIASLFEKYQPKAEADIQKLIDSYSN
ncbi:MAG: hypothetical protein FWD71_07325 [Oscillospiraceae bacterium]|nr:hypothetical protein [Oscillospiraceae bacterium]